MVEADHSAQRSAAVHAAMHSLLALLSLALLSRAIRRNLLSRLGRIVPVSEAVAAGDMDRRAADDHPDELNLVARQLNAVLDRRYQELRGASESHVTLYREPVVDLLGAWPRVRQCSPSTALSSPQGVKPSRRYAWPTRCAISPPVVGMMPRLGRSTSGGDLSRCSCWSHLTGDRSPGSPPSSVPPHCRTRHRARGRVEVDRHAGVGGCVFGRGSEWGLGGWGGSAGRDRLQPTPSKRCRFGSVPMTSMTSPSSNTKPASGS